ncbi:MAG: hypothetical protein ACREQ9_26550, partial [Candidatus Binatia bacterium]
MNKSVLPLALAALLVGGASAASAHFAERTASLWGFVSRSDLVMIGRIGDSRRFEERGHTTVPGAVRLRVEETLRGAASDEEVAILVAGPHQPRYARGERVIVFAERRDGLLRSLQSRSEKIAIDGGATDPVLAAVRSYVAIAAEADAVRAAERLKRLTLELLRSPVPRLHQDAIFDLSRAEGIDRHLTDGDTAALGELSH